MAIRPQIQLAGLPMTGRKLRTPEHPFHIRQLPWVITPFFIAPVVPGETMKNLLFQCRSVTDPIQNGIIGWWLEHYFFYVKHSDLADRTEFQDMMIDPLNWTAANVDDDTPSTFWYHWGEAGQSRINWLKLCTAEAVNWYFRDAEETWDTYVVNTDQPLAQIIPPGKNNFLDSAILHSAFDDFDLTVNVTGTNTMASEIDNVMFQYELLKQEGLTTQTYEEFLATYGVRVPKEALHKPELIRYSRSWQYPSNTIDPADGTPTSAVSWAVSERADKDRLFKEPGFLIGLSVARPKVYLGEQDGSATNTMNNIYSWLPPVMRDRVQSTMKKITAGDGPLANQAGDWWFDVKDLFLYGEQFTNVPLTATDRNIVPLPSSALSKRYMPSLAEIYKVFVDSTGAGGKVYVNSDGVVRLAILGAQHDTSPTMRHG